MRREKWKENEGTDREQSEKIKERSNGRVIIFFLNSWIKEKFSNTK